MYDPAVCRWFVLDLLAEQHYNYTPYAYVYNNPISLIDPFGLDSAFYDEEGNQIYSCENDPNSNINYVVKTTQSTEEMYDEDPDNPEKGNSNPITPEQAESTISKIKKGIVTGEHMENLVQIPNLEAGKNILEVIDDDGNGGTIPENNTEYGTNVNSYTNATYATVKGEPADPALGGVISVTSRSHHSHPSGTNKGFKWQQPPSRTDIQKSPEANSGYYFYVWGMRSEKVYVYNQSGVVATVSQSIYKQ